MNDTNIAVDTPFRWKLVPCLVTVALAVGLPILGALAAALAAKYLGTPSSKGVLLYWTYSQHTFQLLISLIAILIVKRLVPANYGLRWPPGKTYFGAALLWGAFFGVLMTLVDCAPQLISHTAPKGDQLGGALLPRLLFEGVYVGPTEEIPFRSLLVTYLATTMPGKLRIGSFNMNWAGIIVALLFAAMHFQSFFARDWMLAVGQQLYAFALGVFYAYWLEKSQSIVAPIIGHNMSDGVEAVIVAAWMALAH